MATINLNIDNMHCGSCVRRVAEMLNALPGTCAEEVRIGSARVNTTATTKQIQQSLADAGYPAKVAVLAP